jgi:hypothetical protein
VSKKISVLATIALIVLIAAMCGCGQSEPPAASTAAKPAAPAAAAPATAPAPAAASSSTPAPVDGDLPGMKIAVNEIKRTSSTVTLKFTAYNTTSQPFGMTGIFDGDQFHRFRHLAGVHLIDGESKKKYFVVTDSDGKPLCSNEILDIAPSSQVVLWAKFPAPPNEIRKITVEVPHFIPFEDVAITQ